VNREREAELSALEKRVLERLPGELSRLVIGDEDVVAKLALVISADDDGAEDGSFGRHCDRKALAQRLGSLSADAPVSTLVQLRAELMMQGRLR
jgi:hypothetical protein